MKQTFIQLCPTLDYGVPAPIQNWSLYYPLSTNAEWYVSQFVECLSKGSQPSESLMRAKILMVDSSQPFAQQIDWVVGLKSLGIEIPLDTTQMDEYILGPTFLGSNNMYLLGLVAKVDRNCLPKLQKQVVQMFTESIGQDQVELASLYMQLCMSNGDQMKLPCDLHTLLQQYPYHLKAVLCCLKLVHE